MKYIGIIAFTVLIVFAGCAGPVGTSDLGDPDGPGDRDGPGSAASRNIIDLPPLEAQLPASLSSGNEVVSELRASRRSLAASTVGGVVTVVASALQDVKAQGWFQLKESAGVDPITGAFVDELKELAAEQALEFGRVYDVGVREFFGDTYDLGNMILTGTDNDLTVYWFAMPFPGTRYWARIGIVRSGDDYTVELTSRQIDDATSPWGAQEGSTFTQFSTATGSSLVVEAYTGTGYSSEGVTRSLPNDDGSLTYLSSFSSGDGTDEMSIGWGNDQRGGVISVGEWDGQLNASREYYDGNGSLIQQSWGASELHVDQYSWVEQNGFNLADAGFSSAPSTISIAQVHTCDGTGCQQTKYHSTDSGSTWVAVPDGLEGWDPYFKAGASWATGDVTYNWNGGAWDQAFSEGSANGAWVTEYAIGYQIPAPVSAFGGTYYFEDRYPLKYLLPLSGDYAGTNILRGEGSTHSDSWTDESGQTHTWSWTDYRYFIDIDNDGKIDTEDFWLYNDSDGTSTQLSNDSIIANDDWSDDDVEMRGVWLSDNYIWDSVNQREIQVKAPFYTTNSANIPSYLTFSAENQQIVDAVTVRINSIYESDFGSLQFADYADRLEQIEDLPEFDQVEF